MSWIKDSSGNFVNLEDVRVIRVEALAEVQDLSDTHAVFGYAGEDADDDDPSYVLHSGDEESCLLYLGWLEGKLPLIKGWSGK